MLLLVYNLGEAGEENIKSVLPLGAEREVLKRNSLYQSQPFPVGHTQKHNQTSIIKTHLNKNIWKNMKARFVVYVDKSGLTISTV